MGDDDALAYLIVPSEVRAEVGAGRKRALRGGALTEPQKSGVAAITTAALIAAAVAYQVGTEGVVGTFAASGAAIAMLASISEGKTKAAGEAVAAYLKEKGAEKVAASVGKAGGATLSLVDNALSLAFALIRLPVSVATAGVGITGKLIDKTTRKIQEVADKLEQPKTHLEQADLIVQNGTLAFAAALGALTLSGALPLMTIFSVMLWTGKLYASPLGRAVGIVELYMWWINRSADEQKEIADQTKKLAAQLSKQAKTDMAWVKTQAPKVADAIATVGGKIKAKAADAGAKFEAGFAEGIKDADSPLMTALSLGFCRATGLLVDSDNVPKPQVGENPGDLARLAENIFAEAFPKGLAGAPDAEKLRTAIGKLKEVQRAAAAVEAARATLVEAKSGLAEARGAAGIPAAPVGPVPGPAAAPAPEPAAVPGNRKRGVTGAPAPVAAPAPAEAASGTGSTGRPKRSKPAAAPVGEGGRRRKTRRKRMVRRITKKVKDFYY
jgi:hypothetical protein